MGGVVGLLPGGFDLWDIGISLGVMATSVLLVRAVFSQEGQIHVSHERAAAIATGHTDRKTLFENKALRPLLWLMLAIAHRIRMPKTKDWIRRKLVAAGSPNYYTSEEYLALSLGAGIGLSLLLELFHLVVFGHFSVTLWLGGVTVGTGMAIWQLYAKAATRIHEISKRLPYALDLISLAMGAGATFTEAVRTVSKEQGDEPFNVELRALLAEMDLGTTRRRALLNLSDRVPLDSLRTLVASVIQAEELGTPLGDVLHDQATLLRLRRSYQAENKAAVASVRMLIPCLLLVMAVILTVFGPAIVRAFSEGLF